MPDRYEDALALLKERGRLRVLASPHGIDFTSTDYLGLAESDAMREAASAALARGVPVGALGSRLLRGNHPEHEALEAEAAAFFGSEAVLYFSSGFIANFSLFATLPQDDDLVVYDELIHASAHQGMRAGRAARAMAAHNDPQSFDAEIRKWRAAGGKGTPWIATEALYSMDGDRAPLGALIEIATRHDGILVIDEAHSSGVFGPDGRGLGAEFEGRPNVVALHTCGKALGASGALLSVPRSMRDFLVNRCRPFIYTTAPSPLQASIVRAALVLLRSQPERRERLERLWDRVGSELKQRCGVEPSGSQILPVIVGSNDRAVALATAMRNHGYDIRAIRPPTVPEGTARVRISLTLNVDEERALEMINVLSRELASLAA